jgi:flagellar hook protein FlgE
VNQNGAPVGSLTGVAIDQNGYIIANYSNGETQKLYKIPLATFASPDELSAVSGNVFEQSGTSGQVALVQAGVNGTGTISSASLEASNVELANQLTDMIVAQRAYQANTKVISTADSLLNALDQIVQ